MTRNTKLGSAPAAEPRELFVVEDQGGTKGAGSTRRTLLRRGIEVGVSLLCLFLALRTVHPADLLAALQAASLFWILAFVAIMAGVLLLKAWRWQLLFHPEYNPPFGSMLSILCVSYMISNVLPGRAGELARVVLLPAEQPVSAARTVASIVVERLLDLLSVLFMLVCLLPFVNLPHDMRQAAQALGVLALVGAGAMMLLSFWKQRLLRWAHMIFGGVRMLNRPALFEALEHLVDGFALLRTPLGLAVIGLALLSWIGVDLLGWAAAQAFHIQVPFSAIVFAVILTTLSQLLPSTPGYVGVFQLAATMALVPLGIPPLQAATFAFGWWALTYVTLTASGLIAMWVHGISFSQLMGKKGIQA
jgi:glycosyltransferase 2 family protein